MPVKSIEQQLHEHTVAKMERYDEINRKLDLNKDQVHQLTLSVTTWMNRHEAFISAITRAFPKDVDGQPDFDGHRSAHLSWIEDSKDGKELKQYIKKVVAAAVAVGLVSWLWAVVWPAFLHGPK